MLSDAELRKMKCPMSRDFAILLGVEESLIGTKWQSEIERFMALISGFVRILCCYIHALRLIKHAARFKIPRLVLEPEIQQTVYMSRLCALYLPKIMDRFFNLPVLTPRESQMFPLWSLSNTISYCMVFFQTIPVFQHYLRLSSTRTRRITQTLLDRLVEKAPMFRKADGSVAELGGMTIPNVIFDNCQLLGTLVSQREGNLVFKIILRYLAAIL